ncbi:MAG: carboxymuconolactone decarboxylase family protein [Henriciella sp.]|uniref:carboxymuconolactone decarboxylase family protein n=1 Tax=Henriciella sp. TaxID=1968823 RepID=UPI0032EC268C
MSERTTYKLQSLKPLKPESAEPKAREILDEAKSGLGMVPNMYSNMANLPGLLSTYAHGYEHFRQNSSLSPAEQEVVLLSISRENGCTYCMAAHSTLADNASGVPKEVTDALRDGHTLPDEKLAALADFTRQMVLTGGRPTPADVERFFAAGFEEEHILTIILAMAVKTISNYSNHVFGTEVDAAFKARAWE